MANVFSVKPLRVKYSSGWLLVSKDHSRVHAHAKTFSEIVAKAERSSEDNVIMAASKSYHGYIM